jgi:MYXO-CTERM domain-containing protein
MAHTHRYVGRGRARAPHRSPRIAAPLLVAALATTLAPATAGANGALSHVHISQLAYQSLPEGEVKALLDDPQNQLAYEAGSAFPDSGYAASAAYGEYAHWAPFYDDYIDWLRATYGDDFSSAEAQAQIAFLLGATSHGMADQTYDLTLLAREFEIDGSDSSPLSFDQYADYFIVVDDGVTIDIDPSVAPYAILPGIMNMGLLGDDATSEDQLRHGMTIIDNVINVQGGYLARISYDTAWETFPFLGTHIYDPKARGSLPWLGDTVAAYWPVLLRRIHGTDDIDQDLVIRTIPEDGEENFPVSTADGAAYARMGLIFGYGILTDDVTSHVTLRKASEPEGEPIPLAFGTPYGKPDCQFVFFWSEEPLEYHTTYLVELSPGVAPMHGGAATTETFSYTFTTRCDDDHLDECPPLEELVVGMKPTHPTPDAGADVDAGVDAGAGDAGGGAGGGGGSTSSSSGGCAIGGEGGASLSAGMLALALVLARRRRRRA